MKKVSVLCSTYYNQKEHLYLIADICLIYSDHTISSLAPTNTAFHNHNEIIKYLINLVRLNGESIRCLYSQFGAHLYDITFVSTETGLFERYYKTK